MIFQYISSTSESEIQVNFLRGTLLLNQVWEAWAVPSDDADSKQQKSIQKLTDQKH